MIAPIAKIPVAALVRVSTKEQAADDRAGIPRQKEVIRRAAEIHGLNIVHTVELSDVSGTATAQTPEVRRLMDMLRRQAIRGIVVADMDRLVRPERFGDFALLDIFKDTGAKLYSGSEVLDFGDDATFMVGGIHGLFAGMERRMIKKRMQDAKEEKRKRGKHPNSHITLPRGIGYDRKAEKFTTTAEIVAVVEAFRIVDEEGNSNLSQIGKRVGIQHRTLADLLRNPVYTGWRVYSKKRGTEKYFKADGRQADRKKVARTVTEIVRVKVLDPPPVSQDRFDRVQLILHQKHLSWRKERENKAIFLGTGLLRCGICGERIYASSGKRAGKPKRAYYMCKNNYYLYKQQGKSCELENIRQDALDENLHALVADHLSDPAVLRKIVEHHLSTHHEPLLDNKANVEAVLRDFDKKMERLTDAYLAGAIDLAEYSRRKSIFDEDRSKLKPLPARKQICADTSIDEIIRLTVRGAASFRRMTSPLDRKLVLDGMLSRVDVSNDGVTGFAISPFFHASVGETGIRTDTDSSPPPA